MKLKKLIPRDDLDAQRVRLLGFEEGSPLEYCYREVRTYLKSVEACILQVGNYEFAYTEEEYRREPLLCSFNWANGWDLSLSKEAEGLLNRAIQRLI
jgi:hypothetical protein